MPLSERHDLETKPIEPGTDATSPTGYLVVTLGIEERTAFENWLQDHKDAIEKQMADVLTRFETERNQYEGKMPGGDYPYPGAFRVNYPITKKKAREIANRLKQAYLDSDPIWAVGTDKMELREYAEAVEKGLDSTVRNELDEEDDVAQAIFESTLHGSGFLVPSWLYTEEVRRNVESYAGWDGVRPDSIIDLMKFEKNYPNWREDKEAKKLHNQIANGKDVSREFSYTEPVKNQPNLAFVEAARVRAYPTTDGYEGLRTTPLYGFIRTYTYAELKDLAEEGQIDKEALERLVKRDSRDDESVDDEIEEFDVFIGTARYKLPGDKQPCRYKVWLECDDNVLLRVRQFPFWYDEPDLIPLYTRQEEPGFFKRGIAWDLQDDHIILNVMLGLYLNGIDMANSMRFIVKEKSLAEAHLLARRWSPHLPIPYKSDPKEVIPNQASLGHLTAIVGGFQIMKQQADDSTGTSALQSGRESPTDPNAPAAKTAMLLQQVEPNIKEYMRSLEPGFRQVGRWLIWLYYQGISLGWIEGLPGVPEMPVDQLPEIAKNLHPRALLFEFDRQGRTERNLKVVELTAQFAPHLLPQVLKVAFSQFDSQWGRLAQQMNFQPPMPMPGMPGESETTGNPGTKPSANGAANGGGNRIMELLGSLS